jgi:hypothetical protein
MKPFFLILQGVTIYFQYITEQIRELFEKARHPLEISTYTKGMNVSLFKVEKKIYIYIYIYIYMKKTSLFSKMAQKF